MIIKTKKTQLEKKEYIKIALLKLIKKQWWYGALPIAICAGAFFIFSWWWIISGILVAVLYLAFWAIQFYGVTIVEQNKILFDKLMYEIDSRQILIKLNTKQGMQLTWEQIKEIEQTKDAYLLFISKAQFIYLPFKCFNSDNDMRFLESLFKRKNLVKTEN